MNFIGIVGAREFKDKKSIQTFIKTLPKDSVIVTSSCRGVCSWTIEQAKKSRLEFLVFKPDLKDAKTKFEIAERYYKKNRELIEQCNLVHAFISSKKGYAGGTKYEIEYALKLEKPGQIHLESDPQRIIHLERMKQQKINFEPEWERFFAKTFSG